MNFNIDLLRKKIREIISEDYRFNYDKSFFPNDQMKNTCKNAIDAVSKNKLTGKGEAEGTGLRKAYSIMRGEKMSHGQLKRMKAFFDNNYDSYKQEKNAGRNIKNSGLIQKWNLWGGDAAYSWVSQNIKSSNQENQRSKDNRPKGHKRMMDPNNTRTKSHYSYVKNKFNESYVDTSGNLIGFDFKKPEISGQNKFLELVDKWDAGGRIVGYKTYEYWFPIDAFDDLGSLGITPKSYSIETATEEPWKGKKFIVFVTDPKDWD